MLKSFAKTATKNKTVFKRKYQESYKNYMKSNSLKKDEIVFHCAHLDLCSNTPPLVKWVIVLRCPQWCKKLKKWDQSETKDGRVLL